MRLLAASCYRTHMRALRCREKGKPAARRGRKALGPATRGQAAGLPNGEEMWSLSRVAPSPPSPLAEEV